MFRDIYQDRKILVTGHTGFKGSWLVTMLEMLGSTVLGVSLPEQNNSLFKKINKNLSCLNSYTDIRDFSALRSVIEDFKPDLIFHLAAQSLVLESYQNPIDTFSTNVIGTANLLEASMEVKNLKGTVIITTDKVYRNLEKGDPFSELDSLGGNDPYSGSKAACEIVVESWRALYSARGLNVELITARAGNVIGGGDTAKNRLLPDLISCISNSSKLTLRNPEAIRPWQHVIEALQGYLLLGEKILKNENLAPSYNFGPSADADLSVMQVVTLIEEIVGKNFDKSIEVSNYHESVMLKLDSRLAFQHLGWETRLSAIQSLKLTIDFLYLQDSNFLGQMKKQISDYWEGSM